MSFLPPDGPPPELSTTRVSGGASARLIALAVAGVLVAVVGFTVINRPPAPVQPQPTDEAVSRVPWVQTYASPSPTPELVDSLVVTTFNRSYGYAATLAITGGNLFADLKYDSIADYRGSVVLTWADVANTTIPVQVSHVWSAGGPVIYEPFGSWSVEVKGVHRGRGPVALLLAHVPPDPLQQTLGLSATGYTFSILATRHGRNLLLQLELFWPDH